MANNSTPYSPGLVSIITPMFNAGSYIQDAIESVLSQTYANWEMIIADDCSTDNGYVIASAYAANDDRIKVIKTPKNTGHPASARNAGLSIAKGEFIAFLDADDIWEPTKLEKQLNYFKDENTAIVFSYYSKFSKSISEKRIVKAPEVVDYHRMLSGNAISCLTAMYSVERAGLVKFEPIHHEDFLLWLTILKSGYKAVCVKEVLAHYRVGKTSTSSNKIKAMRWYWNIIRTKENVPYSKAIVYFVKYSTKSFHKYLK